MSWSRCSSCSIVGQLPKKEMSKVKRGLPGLCRICKDVSSRVRNRTLTCSHCQEETYNFDQRALKGNSALVCRACQKKTREKELAEQKAKFRVELEERLSDPSPPWHPYEDCPDITPDHSIKITKGGICFGFEYDIDVALSRNKVPMSVEQAFSLGDARPPCNNIAAHNGVWNAYKISELCFQAPSSSNVAWLFCLEGQDPVRVYRYLLYHSVCSTIGGNEIGNKYTWKTEQPLEELGILKMGRYEWGQWQVPNDWSERKTFHMLDKGFQLVEFGNPTNRLLTKWPGGGKHYGRICTRDGAAYALLAFADETSLGRSFFPVMYPEGYVPKNPMLYPMGHTYSGCEGSEAWPLWSKEDHPTGKQDVELKENYFEYMKKKRTAKKEPDENVRPAQTFETKSQSEAKPPASKQRKISDFFGGGSA